MCMLYYLGWFEPKSIQFPKGTTPKIHSLLWDRIKHIFAISKKKKKKKKILGSLWSNDWLLSLIFQLIWLVPMKAYEYGQNRYVMVETTVKIFPTNKTAVSEFLWSSYHSQWIPRNAYGEVPTLEKLGSG